MVKLELAPLEAASPVLELVQVQAHLANLLQELFKSLNLRWRLFKDSKLSASLRAALLKLTLLATKTKSLQQTSCLNRPLKMTILPLLQDLLSRLVPLL